MKKLRKRDKYVIAAVLNLCWYCIAVLVLTAHDKVVPDSLTVAWFAAWTAELGLLAGIKIRREAIRKIIIGSKRPFCNKSLMTYQHSHTETFPIKCFRGFQSSHSQKLPLIIYKSCLSVYDVRTGTPYRNRNIR